MSNINKEELMRGLSDSQVNKSKQDFGTNALAKKETESLWSMFIGAFDDIWIKVLCAALVMKIVISVIGVFVPALAGENDVVKYCFSNRTGNRIQYIIRVPQQFQK